MPRFGSGMTYETLCEVIPIITRDSSSPTNSSDVNIIIKQLLRSCPGSVIYGIGGHSAVLQITEDVAAKVSLKPDGEYARHEQTILELFNQDPCPYIVQSFLHRPDVTFMELLRSGTLTERIHMAEKPRPILQ